MLDSLVLCLVLALRTVVPLDNPLWNWVGCHSNFIRREKWSDVRFCGSWMTIVSNILIYNPRTWSRLYQRILPWYTCHYYVGCSSLCVVKNEPRGPPDQRTPKNLRPAGANSSSSGLCPRWGPPVQHISCPGIGSAPPPILVGYLGFMVAVIPQLAVYVGCWQRVSS